MQNFTGLILVLTDIKSQAASETLTVAKLL